MTGREALVVSRFARAIATYEGQATVQREAAERLAALMGEHFHVLGPRILELGCGTGLLTRQLLARFAPTELVANDLCPGMGVCFANAPRVRFLAGDARSLTWPGVFDAIATASAAQWFGELGAFAARCAEALPRGGVLALSAFGPATLREVAALTGRGLAYPGFEAFTAALGEHFAPLATERAVRTLAFADARAALRHLRETGVTATADPGERWTKARLDALDAAWRGRFPHEGGGLALTYEPFWFVGARR